MPPDKRRGPGHLPKAPSATIAATNGPLILPRGGDGADLVPLGELHTPKHERGPVLARLRRQHHRAVVARELEELAPLSGACGFYASWVRPHERCAS